MNAEFHVLSIMVVALNEERHIPGLKTALDKLDLPAGWSLETILVDGGSSDATVEVARMVDFGMPGAARRLDPRLPQPRPAGCPRRIPGLSRRRLHA